MDILSPNVLAAGIIGVVLISIFVCAFVFQIARNNSRRDRINAGIITPALNSLSTDRLDHSLVQSLPVCQYHGISSVLGSTECAVCLSSFQEKEFVRILPGCQHTFHLPCIDEWFKSHANCPLCRETITLQSIEIPKQHPHNSQSVLAVPLPEDLLEVGIVSPEDLSNSQQVSTSQRDTRRINYNDEGEQNQQTKRGTATSSQDCVKPRMIMK